MPILTAPSDEPNDPRDTSVTKKEDNNTTSICLLIFFAIWISISLIFMKSTNKYQNQEEKQNLKYNHVTYYECPIFDSNS